MITHCVEARVFPSGLKAAAIVDLGGGRGQYLADKWRKDSASTLEYNSNESENYIKFISQHKQSENVESNPSTL